jgi:hypothetical protein
MPANAAIDIDGMPCKIDCRILAPTKPALKQVGAIPGICLNRQAAIVLFPRWLVVDLYSRMLRHPKDAIGETAVIHTRRAERLVRYIIELTAAHSCSVSS